jgi:hypothetical protein
MCVIFSLQKAQAKPDFPGTGVFKNPYFQKYFISERCSSYEYNFFAYVQDSKFRKAID